MLTLNDDRLADKVRVSACDCVVTKVERRALAIRE